MMPTATNMPATVASPAAGSSTSTVHDVPVHVIELILLRLDSSVCLVRAASACKRWRRVVADAGFQARFRSLRLVLGHYVYRHGDPVSVPSSPIPSIIHSRQALFSLDFVPKTDGSWRIADGRGGLLLLRKKRGTTSCRRFNPDLVVCEPRTRRHVAISVLPDMLAGRVDLGLFLLDGGGGRSCIGLYNFRVMAVLLTGHRRGVPAACVYSGRDGTWHDVKCEREGNIDVPGTVRSFFFAGRANGCLHWAVAGDGEGAQHAALVLNEATAAFSQITLPAKSIRTLHDGRSCLRIIGGEDGALRAIHLVDNDLIKVYARRFHGNNEWVLENLVRLPEDTVGVGRAIIVAAHEAYVLVAPRHSRWLFSVDLVTMAVERVRKRNVYNEWEAYPYELPWPPILKA